MKFLFILLFVFKARACEIKTASGLVSLSSPVTSLLVELDLMNDKKLKAVSTFHSLLGKKTSAEKMGGGVFLATKSLKRFQDTVIFFDQSRELRKVLHQHVLKKTYEVTTVGDPFVVHEQALGLLTPFLLHCETQLVSLKSKIEALKKEMESFSKQRPYPLFFFLGEFKKLMPPPLLIGQDGFVSSLAKNKIISSPPSELSYIHWSEKWRKGLPGNTIFISVESDEQLLQTVWIKKDKTHYQVKSPYALAPGLGQVYFMKEFLSFSREHL